MNETQANRLLNVARACRETEHANDFTMHKYGHPCGTPGCALGNYAVRPDLQRSLRIQVIEFGHGIASRVELVGVYGELANYDSGIVCRHFGIDAYEAEDLFSGVGCNGARTPLKAAEYIENFVEQKGFEIVEVPA